jgi:hypothetical protein
MLKTLHDRLERLVLHNECLFFIGEYLCYGLNAIYGKIHLYPTAVYLKNNHFHMFRIHRFLDAFEKEQDG